MLDLSRMTDKTLVRLTDRAREGVGGDVKLELDLQKAFGLNLAWVIKSTRSVDNALFLFNKVFPGWGWRGGSCYLSDDCFIFPDHNDPAHSERLHREFSPDFDWAEATDVDLRPAGRLPRAIVLSMLMAVDVMKSPRDWRGTDK